MVDVKRVFVGGLTPEITVDELKERFQRFCEVLDVQIKKKRNCESMTSKILTIVFFTCTVFKTLVHHSLITCCWTISCTKMNCQSN